MKDFLLVLPEHIQDNYESVYGYRVGEVVMVFDGAAWSQAKDRTSNDIFYCKAKITKLYPETVPHSTRFMKCDVMCLDSCQEIKGLYLYGVKKL